MSASASLSVVKQAGSDFLEDDAMTLAAALSFYSALSLAPLLMIILWLTSFLGQSTQQNVLQQIEQTTGPQASQGIEMVLQDAREQPTAGNISGIIGIAVLLFSASAVFAQLQASMNRIWGVKAAPDSGVWDWVRKRLLSAGMIFAILFLLLVSMVVSTVVGAVFAGAGILWDVVSFAVSLGVFVALFALIFKFLPDVQIRWKHVWIGAVMTAILFAVGQWAIGMYLSRAGVGSSYGAAGALVVLLVWMYYSSLILFFGAELTQAYARHAGTRIEPSKHAVLIESEDASEPAAVRSGRPPTGSPRGPEWERTEPPQSRQPRRTRETS